MSKDHNKDYIGDQHGDQFGDQFDDLDLVDISDAPTDEDVNKINKDIDAKDEAARKVANRAILKKKIAQKKAMRTGQTQRQAKQVQENMSQMKSNPEMTAMMQMMMQGDNLNKLMKQLPTDQLNSSIPGGKPNPEDMKKIIAQMMKKN